MRRAISTPPQLPGFEYERLLGSGGFADVFLYKQQLPRRDVAVKVLLADGLDGEARKRFVAEANVMAQLSTHPYIVTIYHADLAEGSRPYFVMEYCPGASLAERYKARPLDVADALRTGIRVGSAVAAAHAQGILHRDIKPANVLTNGFGWPALTDFGIASNLEGDVPSHTTSLGGGGESTASIGLSVPWSPSEMFQDDPDPDVRSDVFSLAATIHTVLAGRTPFELPGKSNGTLDLIGRIERGAITPIGRDDVPRSLVAVLNTAMSPRRADRYATAVDFVRALQRIELELGYSPTGIDLPSLGAEALARPQSEGGDETRFRPIATVEAQSGLKEPPRPIAPPPAATTVEEQATRVRGITPLVTPAPAATAAQAAAPAAEAHTVVRPRTVGAQSSPGIPAEASGADEAGAAQHPNPRRRGLIIGIAAAAAVVIAAAVIIGVVASPKPKHHSTATQTSDSGGPLVQVVPEPKAGDVTRDGGTVTFTWSNPDPAKGDQYVWMLQATNPTSETVDQPKAVVTGADPASQACIQVRILRSGRTSPNPLTECTK
ncbi:serine/threonine-protein kinase [Gryllotalpicola protaetiae]|uniref:non-specific serine/threonine protein kinase n=1 Tax=Gryllotalpicola protaetiae TaxID=2419771 RepID=A0A387BM07_9MICO|nr:serine/threonine-protein kinase [Gryllotalpicola protaetiae]AYG03064.1 serine/threonine protein kinase [Gryllotalpicola protaetiae]